MRCLVEMDHEDVLTWVPESKRVTEASSHVSDVGNAPGGGVPSMHKKPRGVETARGSQESHSGYLWRLDVTFSVDLNI